MALKLLIGPDIEPVTLEEAKLHLKVETDDDNDLIEALITAAREYCEGFQRRAYIVQTWELWLDAFPEQQWIQLPRPPLQEATVEYYDVNDIAYDFTDFFVDTKSEPGYIVLNYDAVWPTTVLRPANGVCITFIAGYGDGTEYDEAESVPRKVKQAMLLIVGAWYEQRENSIATGAIPKEIPMGAEALLWFDRCF